MTESLRDWLIIPQLVTALSVGFLIGRLYGIKVGRRNTLRKADETEAGVAGWQFCGRHYVIMTQDGAERLGWVFGDFGPDRKRDVKIPTGWEVRDDRR